MRNKLKWNSILVLSAIFSVALAARLLHLILDPLLQRDGALYLFLAERWQETGNYAQTIAGGTVVPPFPVFTIMKMVAWGFPSEIAGRSIALFLGSLVPILGYCISYMLFKNVWLSGISVVFFIFHPVLISYSIQPLRENYYLFFLGLTIISIIKGLKDKRITDWVLCGFFLSFSIYSRYESLEQLVFCPLILFYLVMRKKLILKKAIVFLCAFFLTNIGTSVFLLSITNFDSSFITKISKYSDKIIQKNHVRSFIQIDSEGNK